MPPSASASGASASNGAARSRHEHGLNKEDEDKRRKEEAVERILSCDQTADHSYYEILALKKNQRASYTQVHIKKAYMQQSLLTHPDKNGHKRAGEAFNKVATAWEILGNKEKREKYDLTGRDPNSRFESARAQNPFSGFSQRHASGGAGGGGGPGFGGFGGGFEEDISPEEMFRRVFGGGGFGQFGGFDTGPQFVFNMGGPGIRIHQFGGNRPRRRPRDGEPEQGGSALSTILGLLPVIFLFIFPLISSIFSGGSFPQSSMPRMEFDKPRGVYTHRRTLDDFAVKDFKVDFYVRENDWAQFKDKPNKVGDLHRHARTAWVASMNRQCDVEMMEKGRKYEEAQGWFFQDPEKMKIAEKHPTPACNTLSKLGLRSS